MSEILTQHRRRQITAVGLVGAIIGVSVGLDMVLSDQQFAYWFGKTVEHCPDSEFSCPSQQPGMAMFLIPAVLIIGYIAKVVRND